MPHFIKRHPHEPAITNTEESAITLGQQAYARLRELLMQGAFAPAENIPVRSISERLGLGATPVREALQRLAAEGVLENTANRGVRIPDLSRHDLESLYETRLLLEGEAAALAALRISAAEHERLQETFERVLHAAAAGDATACLAANMRFHFLLYESSRLPLLVKCIEQLWLRFGPYLLMLTRDAPLSERTFFGTTRRAHEQLLAALRRHDADAARSCVRDMLISGV